MRRWALIIVLAGVIAGCGVDPVERNNAGNQLYLQGDYESALRAYQLAQVNAPDRAEPYFNAASALGQIGRTQMAIQALEQALRHSESPLVAAIYYNLGNLHFLAANYDAAVTAYRQALRRDPDDADARHNYELALLRLPTTTPTPQEQQTEPDPQQAEPSVTPTPNPGQDQPTPTPPPDAAPNPTDAPVDGGSEADEGLITPTPMPDGGLSVEEAQQRLDAIQQSQQTLRGFLRQQMTPSAPGERDW